MPSWQIVHEKRIAYNERGVAAVEDDLYIKLDAALADWLQMLDGAKLSTFIFISLREAQVCTDKCAPATIYDILEGIPYEERAIRSAVKWLIENSFVCEAGVTQNNKKTYRPGAYAWFAKRQTSKTGAPRSAKNADSAFCRPLHSVVVDELDSKNNISERKQQQTEPAARKILKACGIFGKALISLSESVSAEIATEWREWIQSAPKGFRNPQGLMISALLADPDAQPPRTLIPAETPRRKGTITGKLSHLAHRKDEA